MAYQRKDRYYKKAKSEGYLSRAAYKLKELNGKFKLIRLGQAVIDLGAAPGGWSQVALEAVGKKGRVLGVDLVPVAMTTLNYDFVLGDINTEECRSRARMHLSEADVVLSDIAPRTTGIIKLDQGRSLELAFSAVDFAKDFLVDGGSLLLKVFEGGDTKKLIDLLLKMFKKVKVYKPAASRKESKETYIICLGFIQIMS